jgi:hypothetical protein
MNQIKRNPSAGGAGARKTDRIGWLIFSDNKSSHGSFQEFCEGRTFATLVDIAITSASLTLQFGRSA